MIDFMEIGPTPCDEPCAQLGTEGYVEKANMEMDAYINQLYRMFPDAPDNKVLFVKKWFNHDFGRYGEVCIRYNMDDHESSSYAYAVESSLPENWDDESLNEISGKVK